jgi:hypothetical protein
MPPFFPSLSISHRNYNYNLIYIYGYILYKVEIFFSQTPFSTHFFYLCMMLYTDHVKLFAEVSELFTHTVFQLIVIHENIF